MTTNMSRFFYVLFVSISTGGHRSENYPMCFPNVDGML